MKIVNSLLLVIAVIMTSGCAGVNSSLQVRSNISPAATAALANTIDQANAALFNGAVGGRPGTFDTRFDMSVKNSRTTIRSDRSWRAH